ncbi:MAG TPA: GAF domain-containing protein [Stellaceae bacterium]|nr:GAF domain-containing protein [Stellaceae bacterium]
MRDDRAARESENAELQRRLAECEAELAEARAQQIAVAEVLQAINSSSGDLAPVFDTILEKAARLYDANFGIFWGYDGELFHAVAVRGSAQFADFLRDNPQHPPPASDLGRLVRGENVVHKADYATGTHATPALNRALVDLGGGRAGLLVALRKDDVLLGAIRIYRQEVRSFTGKQITLVENFAAQAVIAMENARLLTETREALEQQTATAEVLQVINSSPGDLAPVFEAILEKAMRLCQAWGGAFRLFDGQAFRAVAMRGVPAAFAGATREIREFRGTALGRIAEGERLVQAADLADPEYRSGQPDRVRQMLGPVRA